VPRCLLGLEITAHLLGHSYRRARQLPRSRADQHPASRTRTPKPAKHCGSNGRQVKKSRHSPCFASVLHQTLAKHVRSNGVWRSVCHSMIPFRTFFCPEGTDHFRSLSTSSSSVAWAIWSEGECRTAYDIQHTGTSSTFTSRLFNPRKPCNRASHLTLCGSMWTKRLRCKRLRRN
jgi:hypothetical protein